MGPIFLGLNRNKRSLVLDLKSEGGREILLRLIKTADVLTCNVRPCAMAWLGLTYEALSANNPGLVYVGMFGFPQRGRRAPCRAFHDLIQAPTAMPSGWFGAPAKGCRPPSSLGQHKHSAKILKKNGCSEARIRRFVNGGATRVPSSGAAAQEVAH